MRVWIDLILLLIWGASIPLWVYIALTKNPTNFVLIAVALIIGLNIWLTVSSLLTRKNNENRAENPE